MPRSSSPPSPWPWSACSGRRRRRVRRPPCRSAGRVRPSEAFTLDAGFYRFDLSYSGNTEDGEVPQFYAQLEGRGLVNWLLAWDYETDSTVTRIVEVPSR